MAAQFIGKYRKDRKEELDEWQIQFGILMFLWGRDDHFSHFTSQPSGGALEQLNFSFV